MTFHALCTVITLLVPDVAHHKTIATQALSCVQAAPEIRHVSFLKWRDDQVKKLDRLRVIRERKHQMIKGNG